VKYKMKLSEEGGAVWQPWKATDLP